jgi:hypothetical protein
MLIGRGSEGGQVDAHGGSGGGVGSLAEGKEDELRHLAARGVEEKIQNREVDPQGVLRGRCRGRRRHRVAVAVAELLLWLLLLLEEVLVALLARRAGLAGWMWRVSHLSNRSFELNNGLQKTNHDVRSL